MIERIRKVIDYSQLSTTEFADTIGISRSGLTHLLTGRNQPSLDVSRKILAKFPEISTEWLIMGMGKMIRPEEDGIGESAVVEMPESPSDLDSGQQYESENSKKNQQIDLFGEYEIRDESEEVADEEASGIYPEVPGNELEADAVPEVEVLTSKSPKAAVAESSRRIPQQPVRPKRTQENRQQVSVIRRERHPNGNERKLQKIIFFYDDHSFEIYTNI